MRTAGYSHLVDYYGLTVRPNWHASMVAATNTRRTKETSDGVQTDVYEAAKWPGDSPAAHLEFALKYDGTNLQILAAMFDVLPAKELAKLVKTKPTGKFSRRLWYLYEWLTGNPLPVPSLTQGNYVPLVEPTEQYTSAGHRSQRHRVNVNLLGDARFCPTVRRTDKLVAGEASRLDERGRQVIASCPPEVLRRAMHYLYTKETRSSFEIEREQPTADRTERFVALLHEAERESYVGTARLVELQNLIVDPRFREANYRRVQNYVGQSVRPGLERVHFIPPRPADVPALMDGWIACHATMEASTVHPLIHAAVVAYGFVFIHPFDDGNGRAHRFLIHNVLARRSFTPRGVIFPVSAVMLKDAAGYDRSLEAFSAPLRPPLVEYLLDPKGRLTVGNDTAPLYRFMDLTVQAEALFSFVATTIEHDLLDEIHFIQHYDRAKAGIQKIVDVPDRLLDLFIRCCAQNHGRVSKRKRESAFAVLTDTEVDQMERAVQQAAKSVASRD